MYALATNRQDIAGLWEVGVATSLTVNKLTQEHEAEVLDFLSERPAYTFCLVGFIQSNGLTGPHNRGTFYACRDESGQLEGVALIGHFILFETRTNAAIENFARLAQDSQRGYMVLGEQEQVETFWTYYAEGGQAPRLNCRELLLELRPPIEVRDPVPGLRLAALDDVDLIGPAHAQIAFDESGVDPSKVDPAGFRQRCARRIELGQTWVWIEDGRLIFKADVITDTPAVIYIEGVWVNPQDRDKGIGSRCMSQLGSRLLMRSRSICVLVNENSVGARASYTKAGYKLIGRYDTIFLKQEVN